MVAITACCSVLSASQTKLESPEAKLNISQIRDAISREL